MVRLLLRLLVGVCLNRNRINQDLDLSKIIPSVCWSDPVRSYAYGGTGADGIAGGLSVCSLRARCGFGGLGLWFKPGIGGFAGWLGIGIDGLVTSPASGSSNIGQRRQSVAVRGSGTGTFVVVVVVVGGRNNGSVCQ